LERSFLKRSRRGIEILERSSAAGSRRHTARWSRIQAWNGKGSGATMSALAASYFRRFGISPKSGRRATRIGPFLTGQSARLLRRDGPFFCANSASRLSLAPTGRRRVPRLARLKVTVYTVGDFIIGRLFSCRHKRTRRNGRSRWPHVLDRSALRFDPEDPASRAVRPPRHWDPSYYNKPRWFPKRPESTPTLSAPKPLSTSSPMVRFCKTATRSSTSAFVRRPLSVSRLFMQPWTLICAVADGQFPAAALLFAGPRGDRRAARRSQFEGGTNSEPEGTAPCRNHSAFDELRLKDVPK